MPQIAIKVSEPIFAKLKRLAHQGKTNYATIVEAALSAYEPGASENASHSASEIHLLIESALEPVLARLEMLESMGIFKHQHLSGVTVHVTPQNAPEPALDAQPIAEPQSDEESPKIAVSAAVDVIGREAADASSSTPPPTERQPLPPIESVVAELKRQGLKPQAAADELNRRGYRTSTGTPIQRGYVGNVMKRLGD